jgi:hypothetical protein
MSDIDLSILPSVAVGVNGYEVSRFGESITITQIELNLQAVSGKPTMKSILMSSHFHAGILNGCNNPTGLIYQF